MNTTIPHYLQHLLDSSRQHWTIASLETQQEKAKLQVCCGCALSRMSVLSKYLHLLSPCYCVKTVSCMVCGIYIPVSTLSWFNILTHLRLGAWKLQKQIYMNNTEHAWYGLTKHLLYSHGYGRSCTTQGRLRHNGRRRSCKYGVHHLERSRFNPLYCTWYLRYFVLLYLCEGSSL